MLLVACEKEAIAPEYSTDAEVTDTTTPLIQAFLERAHGDGFTKSDATLSLDSAEWYVEAGLNFSLAEAWLSIEEIRRDTFFVELSCDQEMINADGLYSAYLSAATIASATWDEATEHLIIADVQAEELSGIPTLRIVTYIGARGGAKRLYTTFGPNAYFRAMWELSYPSNCGCGPNLNGPGVCAPIQIHNRLNANIPPLSPGQYFTDISQEFASGGVFLWSCPTDCFDVCLGPTELSGYVTSGWTVFHLLQPTGKSKINAYYQSAYPLCCTSAYHFGTFTYGIRHNGASS